ncbi:response regulator [Rhizobium sp. AN5]|uniref:response regulator n=1 Tax=Rhizobium sp. AN5 TaxID=1855304 RepID=UPI0015CBEFAF|nr:response regulator [Rhizobium sp. AN5]
MRLGRLEPLDQSREQARSLTEAHRTDFAFVDIHLEDGPRGIDVGRDLLSQGIPYVFVSRNIKKIPVDFAGALGAIEMPYMANGTKNALAYIAAIVGDEGNVAPPASFFGKT